jgi:DNA-binding Lrp family transcriptional regulator
VSQPTVSLDPVDNAILDLLRENARRTLADIGAHVNLSASAVKRRIDRLEADGVILGYGVQIDQDKLGRHLEAFTELRFAGDTKVHDISSVAKTLPEVQAVFTTAGDPDALVWIRVKDVADLTRVIDLLRRSGQVTGTKTLMVLDTWTASAVTAVAGRAASGS